MKHTLFIAFTFLLISCQSGNDETSGTTDQAQAFRVFLKKFKPLDLPFIFRYGTEDTLNFDKMTAADPNSVDSIFIQSNDLGSVKLYGMLKDTSKFFSVICFYSADDYYPMLITFDKKGNQIDETSLIVNGCGGDCGLEYCSETGIINEDLSIVCVDTVRWKFSCDSLGEPIPDSDIVWIESKNGKITKNGKLTMKKEKQKKYRDTI